MVWFTQSVLIKAILPWPFFTTSFMFHLLQNWDFVKDLLIISFEWKIIQIYFNFNLESESGSPKEKVFATMPNSLIDLRHIGLSTFWTNHLIKWVWTYQNKVICSTIAGYLLHGYSRQLSCQNFSCIFANKKKTVRKNWSSILKQYTLQ